MEALPDHAQGFDRLYGLELTEVADDRVAGRVAVRDELKQPYGLVHGGVYASIAESLASLGTGAVAIRSGKLAMGLSNQTSFLRPITTGTIHAVPDSRPGYCQWCSPACWPASWCWRRSARDGPG